MNDEKFRALMIGHRITAVSNISSKKVDPYSGYESFSITLDNGKTILFTISSSYCDECELTIEEM